MNGLGALLKTGALNRLSVDEIMEFGYPREVAERIASGELLMDEASRAARIAEGETFSPVLYRGYEYGNEPYSDADMWMADDRDMALTYSDSGRVAPLRHNAKNLFELDAEGQWHEDIYAEPWELPGVDIDSPSISLNGTDGIADAVKQQDVHQGSLFRNIHDDKYPPTEYTEEELLDYGLTEEDIQGNVGNVYNILGTRPEVKIRHRDAAYDPQYNGPNIMGATAAGAIGLGSLFTSDDAEARFEGTASRFADHFMLGIAKRMEYQGYDRDNIWKTTGWGRGADGHWRFEVNDNEAYLPGEGVFKLLPNPKPGTYVTMRDGGLEVQRDYKYDLNDERIGWGINPGDYTGVTGGAELINAYPAMAYVKIPSTRVPDPVDVRTGNGGYFHGDATATQVPPNHSGALLFDPEWSENAHTGIRLQDGTMQYLDDPKTVVKQIYAPKAQFSAVDGAEQARRQYQSVLAHETQHAIQHLEGFARGGSDKSAVDDARKYAREEQNYLTPGMYFSGDDVDPLIFEYEEVKNRVARLQFDAGSESQDLLSFEKQQRLQEAQEELEFLQTRFPYLSDAHSAYMFSKGRLQRAERASRSEGKAYYRSLAGEVEARNDQYRLSFTDEQRRRIPPWETEDVPREKQYTGQYATPQYGPVSWQPYAYQQRLAGENILPMVWANEVQDLMRGGMSKQRAADMVNDQLEIDRSIRDANRDLLFDFRASEADTRARMLDEAEELRHQNLGKNKSPYFAQAGAALAAAAAANANAANAGEEPGVLEELYDNSYVGQEARGLGDIVTNAGIQQMVDAANGIDFNPVVNDFSGTLFDVTAARNELNPTARDIFTGGMATAVEPTFEDRVSQGLQDLGLYEGNPRAAYNAAEGMGYLATGAEVAAEFNPLYWGAMAIDRIPEAQQNIATGEGGLQDYLTLGLEAMAGMIPGGRSTIRGAFRKDYPGIYQSPDELLDQVQVEPETGVLEQVFGATRQDLADIGRTRQGNRPAELPNAAANPRGTPQGEAVMKPANTRRLVNSLENAMGTELEKGMSGWYVMDPLYDAYRALGLSEEEAAKRFRDFQAFTGIHSSASDVVTELTRGTGALYLNEQGRMDDYFKWGNAVGQPGAPADMDRFPGHFAHSTAHGVPLSRYIENGALTMDSPKVPLYIQSAGVPQTGFQTEMPVGDAHFSRAIGLADTRPPRKGKTDESWTTPEAQQLTPWWRDEVAGQVDLESVPAQALAWGLFSPQTGVDTAVGVPKLEILAQLIVKRAKERGISIDQARDEILMGQDYVSGLTPK